eukprot:scaffold161356_cov15-Tisochrysis_lutea.AAC.1
MDLGRSPIARFPNGDVKLSEQPITSEDLDFAIQKVCGISVLCIVYPPFLHIEADVFSVFALDVSASSLEGREIPRVTIPLFKPEGQAPDLNPKS